jgi:hypothetical protein
VRKIGELELCYGTECPDDGEECGDAHYGGV